MTDAEGRPAFSLNGMTLGPLLRLMLAQRDLEPPGLSPLTTWEVFRTFLGIPAGDLGDVASFQATWELEPGSEESRLRFLYCTLTRELTGDPFRGDRAVQIQWAVDADLDLEDVQVWSDAFPDLDAFFTHVEGLPHFHALRESWGPADLFVTDLED